MLYAMVAHAYITCIKPCTHVCMKSLKKKCQIISHLKSSLKVLQHYTSICMSVHQLCMIHSNNVSTISGCHISHCSQLTADALVKILYSHVFNISIPLGTNFDKFGKRNILTSKILTNYVSFAYIQTATGRIF